jgi:acyl-CoA thioesterase
MFGRHIGRHKGGGGQVTRTTPAGHEAARTGPAQRMFADDPASRALGIELLEAAEGAAVLRMTVTAQMVNGHGTAHGGYLFLFADSAFACACNSHGPVTVAAAADIDFVAPAHEGDVLVATARERTRFGRSGIYDVSVRRGDQVVAEFRGRSRTLRDAPGGTKDSGAKDSGAKNSSTEDRPEERP